MIQVENLFGNIINHNIVRNMTTLQHQSFQPTGDKLSGLKFRDQPSLEDTISQANDVQPQGQTKQVEKKAWLSWTNILISLTVLLILAFLGSTAYFRWVQVTTPESKITSKVNTLLEVSQLDSTKQPPIIQHPNDGSGSSKVSSYYSSSTATKTTNDKPHKSSGPIPKSDSSKTILGSDDPGDDEEEDEEDPNKKKKGKLNKDSIFSDAQEESEQQPSEESFIEDDQQQEVGHNWMTALETPNDGLVGTARP